VWVQAPPHVVENQRNDEKAAASAGKKKVVKKKQPDRGYAHWTQDTFDRIVGGEPEPAAAVGWLTTDTTDGPYRLLIDGRDAGLSAPIPPDRPLPLKPGQRRITFVRGPHRKALLVTIVDGQTAALRLPNPQPNP
jgi:hypothetical protein